jgi:plastocyanin
MRMSPRSRLTGSLFALLLVSSAASVMLPAAPAGAAIKTINAFANASDTTGHWAPALSTAAHGVTIHWHAVSGKQHTVTAYGGNWSFTRLLNKGGTVSRAFPTKGVFRFYCKRHGYLLGGVCHGMCGKITIT